jgi:3-oxoacyl-[acyl-carrier-protein] synthase III
MGWGTFIAGRVLRERRPQPGLLEEAGKALDNHIKNQTNQELEVFEEINRLKSLGIEVDIHSVRSDIRKRRKARQKMGNQLKLSIVLKAQEKVLAGEPVNYDEIEREILAAYKPINWERFLKPFFPDYYRVKSFLVKHLNNRR